MLDATASANTVTVPDGERYLNDHDLERLTTISRVTWQVMRAKGTGPIFSRIGRRCVYRWSDVQEWIAARSVATTGAR